MNSAELGNFGIVCFLRLLSEKKKPQQTLEFIFMSKSKYCVKYRGRHVGRLNIYNMTKEAAKSTCQISLLLFYVSYVI